MKVEKIDIKREYVDVKNDVQYLEYYKFDNQFKFVPMGLMKPDIKSVIYPIFKYITDKNITKFLAFKEEDRWFKEILETNDKTRKDIHHDGVLSGIAVGKAIVKKLSWWKRLFNKF